MKRIWQDIRDWLRHPNWAWTARRAAPLAIAAGLASWLFGLGFDKLLEILEGGLKGEESSRAHWMAGGFLVVSAVLYLVTLIARRERDRMLRTNGTAFVVMEKADDWRKFDHGNFYQAARRRFAKVIEVPPTRWGWPMGARARYWELRFAGLLASFRALYRAETEHADGAPASATGVFVTAPLPVAMALGYRLRADNLDLDLDVWQRPSHLRAGKVDPVIWGQRPHRYDSLDRLPKPETVAVREECIWDVSLTVDRSTADPDLPDPPADGPVSLLLVRFGRQPWAELPRLPDDYGKPGAAESARLEAPGPVDIKLQDMAGVIPVQSTTQVHLYELRIVQTGKFFPWEDSPYLVAEAIEWILRKTEELRGHTLLLGATIQNDVAIGIGLAAGLPSCVGWPLDLWPIVHREATKTRLVPNLNLGSSGAVEPGT